MNNRSLLLHTCCAPCVSHVYGLFAGSHDVTVFYYNPNIAPQEEYGRRLSELERFGRIKGFPLVVGGYDVKEWTLRVGRFADLGERSQRCWECYRFRLEESFRKAKELGIAAVTTSLSISPHKDAVMINNIGKELEGSFGVAFIEGDFKKNDGFRRSVELSREYGFYRQDYCGCVYSMRESEARSKKKKPEQVS
ncbi:MAG TPA: epoxyqueuosine reductase QueH [Spirochaetota bacterium]|nr:epoxyqueuosine reductase QueH [Spirochaetota bacterium]HPC41697.1 epoxyqueuosine reductase QueH [Spirochaetota bacterium]HPL15653.1 epoxyqueuosine reductase QueH [Spirochaetota bacterium]HQF09278.1 epoxyqueuosine reductase QueH [Spirochaetota bacterium]HQH98226.1 epoxyqueuosine reductase QueH [Spirochaetota bacterium]